MTPRVTQTGRLGNAADLTMHNAGAASSPPPAAGEDPPRGKGERAGPPASSTPGSPCLPYKLRIKSAHKLAHVPEPTEPADGASGGASSRASPGHSARSLSFVNWATGASPRLGPCTLTPTSAPKLLPAWEVPEFDFEGACSSPQRPPPSARKREEEHAGGEQGSGRKRRRT